MVTLLLLESPDLVRLSLIRMLTIQIINKPQRTITPLNFKLKWRLTKLGRKPKLTEKSTKITLKNKGLEKT